VPFAWALVPRPNAVPVFGAAPILAHTLVFVGWSLPGGLAVWLKLPSMSLILSPMGWPLGRVRCMSVGVLALEACPVAGALL